jgi:hypothetical protein
MDVLANQGWSAVEIALLEDFGDNRESCSRGEVVDPSMTRIKWALVAALTSLGQAFAWDH